VEAAFQGQKRLLSKRIGGTKIPANVEPGPKLEYKNH